MADLASPTTGRLLDARGPLRVDEDGVHPARGIEGVVVCSMDMLLEDGAPLAWREPASERFVWRGTLEAGALREFLADVVWGELDVLLICARNDRIERLTSSCALAGRSRFEPEEESRRRWSARATRRQRACHPGVVENMSGYAWPDAARALRSRGERGAMTRRLRVLSLRLRSCPARAMHRPPSTRSRPRAWRCCREVPVHRV